MRDLTRTGIKINSKIGKAVSEYEMIKENDRILVAVSGGKDSMTLIQLLSRIKTWAPVNFDILAVHVSTDFHCSGCAHEESLGIFFKDLNIEFYFRDIKVLDDNGETNCFWCSWNRRKALFELAEEVNCNKLALGHHKDDIVETLMLNMLYNGEISAMNPMQEMFNGKISIIRPLCYVEEKEIIKFADEMSFPKQLCNCPFGRDSKRKFVKEFIISAEEKTPKVNIKTNIFKSVTRIKSDYINLKGGNS